MIDGATSVVHALIMETQRTERLTNDMILSLRAESASAGDQEMVRDCDTALRAGNGDPAGTQCREECAKAINSARAMSGEFAQVVA